MSDKLGDYKESELRAYARGYLDGCSDERAAVGRDILRAVEAGMDAVEAIKVFCGLKGEEGEA